MANLAQIIPALFVKDGELLTPEQIKRRQALSANALAFATDTSPNAGGVASILAKGLAGFRSGWEENRANAALEAAGKENQSLISSLLGGLGGTGGLGQTATSATPTVAPVQNVAPATNWDASTVPETLKSGIQETATALGVDPIDLATAISYETAGTFDPTKSGPTTQWGQHRGLIQFGEPQAQKYGVDWNNPIGSQLGANGAVANYLRDTGVQPGMGLLDIYSAINAGGVGRYNRSDANNGGAPGTVRDKVEQQMADHRAKAVALFGGQQAAPSDNGIEAALASSNRSAFPPAPTAQSASSGVNPAIIAALSSPVANEQTRSVATALLNNQLSQQQAAQELVLKQQQQQQAIAQRQAIAQSMGINPGVALDENAWKAAVEAANRGRQTVTVGNNVYDLANPSQPLITGSPERLPLMNLGDGTVYDPNAPADQRFIQAPNATGKVPDSVRALEIRAERAGLQPGTPEYNQFMISGGNGGTTLSVSPDGSVQFSQGGSGKSLTEAQSKDAFFAARMTSAMPTLDKYENSLMSLPEAAAGSLPAGRYLQSEEYQLARDAGDDFVATYLRKDSGAALTKEERTEYGNMLLPQPGDKPAIIEAKRIRRQVAARAIQLGLPQTAVDNMVKAVGEVDGAGIPVPTTNQSQPQQGWKDLGNGVKIRPKGSN